MYLTFYSMNIITRCSISIVTQFDIGLLITVYKKFSVTV